MPGRRAAAAAAALAVLLVLPATASADPPANDDRANAIVLGALPERVSGTTVDATVEPNDPGTRCPFSTNASVYYTFTAAEDGRVVAQLEAAGDMDAVVDVFRRTRSQLESLTCDATDAEGRGAVGFPVRKGQTFVIRVAKLFNSVAGTFDLHVAHAQPAARPPGTPLPGGGVRGTVDRVLNPSDAFAVDLRAGRTYRMNLVTQPAQEGGARCVRLSLYGRGTKDFDSGKRRLTRSCGGYVTFTPGAGRSGRYSLLVQAEVGDGPLPYRLQVASAGSDDTAPGVFIRNHAHVRAGLRGSSIDVVDLYRFDVTRFSTLDLTVASRQELSVSLLNDRGKRIAAGGEINRRIRAGRYFVAVRTEPGVDAAYSLRRVSRTITKTQILANGERSAEIAPGGIVRWGVRVSPGASGPVRLVVQRFDPLAGWQFAHLYDLRATAGSAGVSFRPPHVGRWRARAVFTGTRIAAPSTSRFARVLVAGPLDD